MWNIKFKSFLQISCCLAINRGLRAFGENQINTSSMYNISTLFALPALKDDTICKVKGHSPTKNIRTQISTHIFSNLSTYIKASTLVMFKKIKKI